MTPGEELAREAARLERAHYNMPLPRPIPDTPDTETAQSARRAAMLREFNDARHLKAVS